MDKIFEKLDMGNVSDGYHTFNELYRYRMLYNAAFFNELAKGDIKVCKSHKHYDGEECFGGGWFIVMAELPTGQISNHYENRYWELFNIPELDTTVAKSPSSSSISLYILWISLLRMTVLSLTYIFSTSSSQKKILSL